MTGANLKGISTPAMQIHLSEILRSGVPNPARTEFGLITHSAQETSSSSRKTLAKTPASKSTCAVRLNAPARRRCAAVPPACMRRASGFTFADLKEDKATHQSRVEQFTGSAMLCCIRTDVPLDPQLFPVSPAVRTRPSY